MPFERMFSIRYFKTRMNISTFGTHTHKHTHTQYNGDDTAYHTDYALKATNISDGN